MAAIAKTNTVNKRPNRLICSSNGVVIVSTLLNKVLMWPISVCEPVTTTTAVACPVAIKVPEYSIELRSPNTASAATASLDFSAGTDSPVRIDSSIRTPRACSKRASAGTRSPASRSKISPGTSSSTAKTTRSPSRNTRAVGDNIERKADNDCSALPSCTKPIIALIITTARMTPASI